MFLTLRDPGFHYHPFNHYRQLRRELDDLLEPTLYVLQHMAPKVPTQKSEDKFEVSINVENFSPQELTVKMVDDFVEITGKHEEKQDEEGFISRHFVRRYKLPDGIEKEKLNCNLSSDGVLIISAPKAIEGPKEVGRNVPINFTGQPANNNAVTNKNEEVNVVKEKLEGTGDAIQNEATTGA